MRNRQFCVSALICAAFVVVALAGTVPAAHAQERKAVNLSSTQGLPFSDGIIVGNTLYVAGEQGTNAKGKLEEGIAAQTRAALENVRQVLTKAGFSMKNVVAVNVYLSNIQDFAAMNKVYGAFFPNPKPTRTTIQAAALVNGARIEISAVAIR